MGRRHKLLLLIAGQVILLLVCHNVGSGSLVLVLEECVLLLIRGWSRRLLGSYRLLQGNYRLLLLSERGLLGALHVLLEIESGSGLEVIFPAGVKTS